MANIITNPRLQVNDVTWLIVPNSLKFKEGLGEQNMKVGSYGENEVEAVYSDNVETNLGMITVQLYATVSDIELALATKANANNNVCVITGADALGNELRRTFNGAAILNDYEVLAASEGTIDIEFTSQPAV